MDRACPAPSHVSTWVSGCCQVATNTFHRRDYLAAGTQDIDGVGALFRADRPAEPGLEEDTVARRQDPRRLVGDDGDRANNVVADLPTRPAKSRRPSSSMMSKVSRMPQPLAISTRSTAYRCGSPACRFRHNGRCRTPRSPDSAVAAGQSSPMRPAPSASRRRR